jgi:hypothetical protein
LDREILAQMSEKGKGFAFFQEGTFVICCRIVNDVIKDGSLCLPGNWQRGWTFIAQITGLRAN